MTTEDDPFGRSDRTIIRPNPAGRRTPPSPSGDPASGPPQGGAPPASTPRPPVAYPAPPGAPPGPPPPRPGQAGWDDWMAPPSPNNLYVAPETSAPMTPAPISPHVSVDLVTVAASPLMRAAASLLVMLGRLRASLVRAGPNQLMDQVAQAIEQFEIDARAAGAPNDQIETAKYALAATADDIVQNLPTADSRTWTQYSMLVRFFNERMGGVRFFKELERAKQNPAVNLGVLEVMHACLSLGFEGVYRASGGPGAAQGLRRDLYETIRRAQPKAIEDSVAPLARPGRAAREHASSGSRLGCRRGCGGRVAWLLPLSAQRPHRSRRGARAEDGGHPSGDGIDDRARNDREAAARSQAAGVDATRAHPRGARQGNHGGQGWPTSPRRRSSFASAMWCFFLQAAQRSATPSRRSRPRSPPRSTASQASFMSTATRIPIRFTPSPSHRTSCSPRRAPSRSLRC